MDFVDKEVFESEIKKIENSIEYPEKYKSVRYHENGKLTGIYPAEMLRNSVIQIEP